MDLAIASRACPRNRALLGLIGAPISHSATPAMHEAAGDAIGIRLMYQLCDVPGLDQAALAAMLRTVCTLGFAGFNVTFPYKQAILPLLDALDPAAREIGAVNTVVIRNGQTTGHNTDATGLRQALQPALDASSGPVALIGAGGVGRAAAFALRALGRATRIYDTDPDRADALADAVGATVCRSVEAAVDGAAGLFNGTPVGMLPDRSSPIPAPLLHAGLWVADAVYNPLITPLLEAAARAGARTIDGSALAIHQARDAFALFTGHTAPPGVMEQSFAATIAARTQAVA